MNDERAFHVTNAFKRDLKKHHLALIGKAWADVIQCLATNTTMPAKYRDHALSGDFVGFRDCHIKPDLVLVYRITENAVELHRLGTHSELFD